MSSLRPTREHLLIKSLVPRAGDPIELGTISVLIGAGNAGKTELLRDILRLGANLELTADPQMDQEAQPPVLLKDLSFANRLTLDRLLKGLATLPSDVTGETYVHGIGPDLATPQRYRVTSQTQKVLHRPLISGSAIGSTSLAELMPQRFVHLDQRRRTSIAGSSARSPLQPPESLLQLLQDAPQTVHDELDRVFSRAFDGLHVRLDTTQRISLALRVASEFPDTSADPVNAARQFADLKSLDEQGDGWRDFVLVVLTMLLCQGRVILMDQPSVSLQQGPARQLGAWVADHAPQLSCQVIVVTQDLAFMRGLFEGRTDVGLLRCERYEETTRLRAISPKAGQRLAQHPLLASQKGLDCLFTSGIVLVAQDSDRVLYETVARWLGTEDLGFLHSYGGGNLATVAAALSATQLPMCVIADLDVLREETGFVNLVQAVTGSPPPKRWLATREQLARHVEQDFDDQALSASAREVENFLGRHQSEGQTEQDASSALEGKTARVSQARWDRLKTDRLRSLPAELRTWVEELGDDLKRQGIFMSWRANAASWMSDAASSAPDGHAFVPALEAISDHRCPADLRAFVVDVVAQVRAMRLPARAARAGQGA